MNRPNLVFLASALCAACAAPPEPDWQPLFPSDGVVAGWIVCSSRDAALPPPDGARWLVRDGVLTTEGPRGTCLLDTREFGDFDLDYEFRLGPRGNSGCFVRAPLAGDPSFEGIELQMVDPRYYDAPGPAELAGSIYGVLPPRVDAYRPEAWNRVELSVHGSRLRAHLNGVLIHDVDLAAVGDGGRRHDDTPAPPLCDRPQRGHLGFQELSRDGGHVAIRNARLRVAR